MRKVTVALSFETTIQGIMLGKITREDLVGAVFGFGCSEKYATEEHRDHKSIAENDPHKILREAIAASKKKGLVCWPMNLGDRHVKSWGSIGNAMMAAGLPQAFDPEATMVSNDREATQRIHTAMDDYNKNLEEEQKIEVRVIYRGMFQKEQKEGEKENG